MFIFIYGDDTFQVHQKVQSMKKHFQEKFDKTGLNLSVFSFEEKKTSPAEILQSIATPPFLSEKRMVIIRDLIGVVKKPDLKLWEERFKKIPESTIVVFWETLEPKVLEKKPLFQTLKNEPDAHAYVFANLSGLTLVKWILKHGSLVGAHMDERTANTLAYRIGPDLWRMDQVLRQLAAYANGNVVSVHMIDDLVAAVYEDKIFALIDAIALRKRKEALLLLQEQRFSGSNDFYLLTMLARQIRLLIQVGSLVKEHPSVTKQEIAKELGIHPFVAQKTLAQSKQFSFPHLLQVHERLFELDRGAKIGHYQGRMAVDLLLANLFI